MDYLNKIFREQFEIVKIGLWSWHNNSFMNFISQLWGKVEYFFIINSENPHPSWAKFMSKNKYKHTKYMVFLVNVLKVKKSNNIPYSNKYNNG